MPRLALLALLLTGSPLFAQDAPLRDDLSLASLEAAAARSLAFYDSVGSSQVFAVQGATVSAADLAEGIRRFVALYKETPPGDLDRRVREEFHVLSGTPTVLFTGYYEPSLEASTVPAPGFPIPLLARPPDLVEVETALFNGTAVGEKLWGRVEGGKLVPYLNREQIDYEGALDGKGLEIVWLRSRWDAVNVHIQGSSHLRLPDGSEARVLFAGSNGRPFKSPARALVERGKMRADAMSSQGARAYVEAHPEEERAILGANPRYTFFRLADAGNGEGPLGTVKQPLEGERSIAVDPGIYPLGGLAWYTVDLPKPDGGKRRVERFAFMQDTGGAIRGPGRVDVYFGRGESALAVAGRLKADGRLHVLLKK